MLEAIIKSLEILTEASSMGCWCMGVTVLAVIGMIFIKK
jgi:hypothetical protein